MPKPSRKGSVNQARLSELELIQDIERKTGTWYSAPLDMFSPYAVVDGLERIVERRYLKGEPLFDVQTPAEDYVHRAFYAAWRKLSSRGFQSTPATHDLTDGFMRTALEVSGSKSRVDQVVRDWAKAVPEVQRFEALNDRR